MTLQQTKTIVNETLENYNLKDIESNRIFVYVARETHPNISNKELMEFGVSQQNCSIYYRKCKDMIDINPEYKKVVDEVFDKIYVREDVDSNNFGDMIDKVREFRDSFELKVKHKPSLVTKSEYDLHYKLLREEIDEYFEACEEGDKKEVLDAQVDILYILLGCVLHHGTQDVFEKAFDEIHASNMSKLENGKVLKREDGKVMKGKDYFKPDLDKFIKY